MLFLSTSASAKHLKGVLGQGRGYQLDWLRGKTSFLKNDALAPRRYRICRSTKGEIEEKMVGRGAMGWGVSLCRGGEFFVIGEGGAVG